MVDQPVAQFRFIGQSQFGANVGDVCLDGFRSNTQNVRDLAIGVGAAHELEDLLLAASEQVWGGSGAGRGAAQDSPNYASNEIRQAPSPFYHVPNPKLKFLL